MENLIQYLSQFVSPNRFTQMQQVVKNRTEYVVPVLEDIEQPQNASAVIRTCDCLGINKLCVIENKNEFGIYKDIVRGSTKWVDIKRYNTKPNNTIECLTDLKKQGYRILSTLPRKEAKKLSQVDINKGKCAVVFGSEPTGITKNVADMSDEFITIPMCGFTESLNLSVSVAVVLYTLKQAAITNGIKDFFLNTQQQNILMLSWLKKCIAMSTEIINRYNLEHGTNF